MRRSSKGHGLPPEIAALDHLGKQLDRKRAQKAYASAGLADMPNGLVNHTHGATETAGFDKRADPLAGCSLLC